MTIYIENHSYGYEMENLVRLFYPNEKLEVISGKTSEHEIPRIETGIYPDENGALLTAGVFFDEDGISDSMKIAAGQYSDDKECERLLAVLLYGLLCRHTGKKQPWGILTGVRPIKLFRRLSQQYGEQYAADYFTDKLLVSPQKTALSAVTEKYERDILDMSRRDSCSLYISIPFCPTRCSYCSFVSQTVEKTRKLVKPYFELLLREIEYTSELVRRNKLRMESIYIGGGTPTTLSAQQLSELIETVRKCFDMEHCREFTIEAGRPDTIDAEKLQAIYSGKADRISINPQTLNDSVLEVIGRKHNSAQTLEAFELARKTGFSHINMDLIAGLPTESVESFVNTLDTICGLSPESITVHTLALKRSSRLNLQGSGVNTDNASNAALMLDYAQKKLFECGYHPYYLYRQTRMEGNLENVGWSKEGFDGIYNIFVMDETHTILGCGAGAVTKLRNPDNDELVRIFNYKYPYEYIAGFDEMLKRKEQVNEFYDQLS